MTPTDASVPRQIRLGQGVARALPDKDWAVRHPDGLWFERIVHLTRPGTAIRLNWNAAWDRVTIQGIDPARPYLSYIGPRTSVATHRGDAAIAAAITTRILPGYHDLIAERRARDLAVQAADAARHADADRLVAHIPGATRTTPWEHGRPFALPLDGSLFVTLPFAQDGAHALARIPADRTADTVELTLGQIPVGAVGAVLAAARATLAPAAP